MPALLSPEGHDLQRRPWLAPVRVKGGSSTGPRARRQKLERFINYMLKMYPELPGDPLTILIEAGMTGRVPIPATLIAAMCERDPKFSKLISESPWLADGFISTEVRVDCLKATLPYLHTKAPENEDEGDATNVRDMIAIAARSPSLRRLAESAQKELVGVKLDKEETTEVTE